MLALQVACCAAADTASPALVSSIYSWSTASFSTLLCAPAVALHRLHQEALSLNNAHLIWLRKKKWGMQGSQRLVWNLLPHISACCVNAGWRHVTMESQAGWGSLFPAARFSDIHSCSHFAVQHRSSVLVLQSWTVHIPYWFPSTLTDHCKGSLYEAVLTWPAGMHPAFAVRIVTGATFPLVSQRFS